MGELRNAKDGGCRTPVVEYANSVAALTRAHTCGFMVAGASSTCFLALLNP